MELNLFKEQASLNTPRRDSRRNKDYYPNRPGSQQTTRPISRIGAAHGMIDIKRMH